MDLLPSDTVLVVGAIVIAALAVYAIYRDHKRDRSPEGIEAARQKALREAQALTQQEAAAQGQAEWARRNPRLSSLIWAVSAGVFAAGFLWAAFESPAPKRGEWVAWLFLLFGGGAAIVAAFSVLGVIFTPAGAVTVTLWLVGGGAAIYFIHAAFESVQGTIVLGVVVIVAVIWVGVEQIKREIRNRQ